ncbi:ATP-binding protein [candidate division CSSED10-310 bacterium]|uniref:histidine kinase n=1 Tax=candidate division CSSED10-310 bacterium TaxID=2855610 RepID=A0ABV6YW78_UNCC1
MHKNEQQDNNTASRNDDTPNVERDTDFDQVFHALRDRPKLSIKMQIYYSFLASFVIIFGLVFAHLFNIYKMEDKIYFLELSNSFLFEIHQARRFEKNFFLHGTNLGEALENVHLAKRVLMDNSDRWMKIVGKQTFNIILPHLLKYEDALQNLATRKLDRTSSAYSELIGDIEAEVRKHGLQLINFAEDLKHKEKNALDRMIITSRRIHIYSFLFLFIFIAFNTYFLGLRILKPLSRFLLYTQRISEGDITPIGPARRYRDEFSRLAIAINKMVGELDRRQNILIESAKLRAVGTLTAGVAHELNNPINNITLTAHMLLEDFSDLPDEEKLDMINDIIKESARSQHIVKNLLDFARESESSMQALGMEDVLQETLRLAGNQITLKGVIVDLKVMPGLPRIYADKQQLTQVFLNLIINALEVSEKNSTIQVLVLPSDDPKFIEIKVTDFGPGIPDHILPSIFDPFFTTKGKKGGTGLGLSVSQGIITKFGGHISVTTQFEKGTTFIVSLPVTSFTASLGRN